MELEEIVALVGSWENTLVLAPDEASGAPEIAWGDYFFYWAPDAVVPANQQPFATIVTKDYPGDAESRLAAADRWRVNLHVSRARFEELTGEDPRPETRRPGDSPRADPRARPPTEWDVSAADTIVPHPVYRALSWISVVTPGERTGAAVAALLREAYEAARQRAGRRESPGHD